MTRIDRRAFLQRSAAAGFGTWLAGLPFETRAADPGSSPDLVVLGAKVYTVDDKRPRAEAFAVKDGRFVAVGSTADVRRLAGPGTKTIDASGATVVPGFIDAHTHPASAGIEQLFSVDCDRRKIAEIAGALAERARGTPDGQWVKGFKYDDTKLDDGRPLNRKDLDAAVPNHPCQVVHRGGHTVVVNSVAFKLAKVDRDTPDPVGGRFGRDEQGELTGFVAEKARDVFDSIAPRGPITRKQRQEAIKAVSTSMSAAGLTSVHDATVTRDFLTAYEDAAAVDEMRFRVWSMVHPDLYRELKQAGIRTGHGNDMLKIGGLKLFSDGSCSERTMRMRTPYEGRPDDYGILVTTQEELDRNVEDAHAYGFQVGVHANGDVAIDMVLTAYERAQRKHPRPGVRHRIEHCTLIDEDLLQRIAKQSVVPLPFYTYVHWHGDKWAQYGPKRLERMFAHRSFLDHGIRVAGASDYVPGPFQPLMAVQSMVTRKDYTGRIWGENQKVTVDEALRIATLHGAYASYEEDRKGSIVPGKLADFVLLGADPHDVDPDRIKHIPVQRTVLGGKTVHEA